MRYVNKLFLLGFLTLTASSVFAICEQTNNNSWDCVTGDVVGDQFKFYGGCCSCAGVDNHPREHYLRYYHSPANTPCLPENEYYWCNKDSSTTGNWQSQTGGNTWICNN